MAAGLRELGDGIAKGGDAIEDIGDQIEDIGDQVKGSLNRIADEIEKGSSMSMDNRSKEGQW